MANLLHLVCWIEGTVEAIEVYAARISSLPLSLSLSVLDSRPWILQDGGVQAGRRMLHGIR